MTRTEVMEMLSGLGIPTAYHHFAEGEAPSLPYLVYHYPKSEGFAADNVVYAKEDDLAVELYTEKRDIEMEDALEQILDAHDLYYVKTEIYIPDEDMYEILYEMRVFPVQEPGGHRDK